MSRSDAELIADLEKNSTLPKNKGGAMKAVQTVPTVADLSLTRWKWAETAYFRAEEIPVRARGLFTHGDDIVLRGFDKFFNTDEKPQTRWTNMEVNTRGPYDIMVKLNGALILMTGYKGNLIVTSKHSTNSNMSAPDTMPTTEGTANVNRNFPAAARAYINRYLAVAGATEAEFAATLEKLNVTAAAELCDDDFEEHVISYKGDQAGLYLLGLVENKREFAVKPVIDTVQFASDYGFPVFDHVVKDSLSDTKAFLDGLAATGTYNGREIEGFVVKCQAKRAKDTWADFYFKYKFEQPYLMYRQWRESTRALILKRPNLIPANSAHRASTLRYLRFLSENIDEAFETAFLKGNVGHVEMRKRFLASGRFSQKDLLREDDELLSHLPVKVVLILVATLGSGKTTVANALSTLTGWAHIQSDDLPRSMKQKGKELARRAGVELLASDGVIMDRNNHLKVEREHLIEDIFAHDINGLANLKFVALNFLPDGPTPETAKATRARVKQRDGNHQTITNLTDSAIDGIIKGFENRFQVVDPFSYPDNQFDLIIDLDAAATSRTNLETAIAELNGRYDLGISCDEAAISTAMKKALAYSPERPSGNDVDKKVKAKSARKTVESAASQSGEREPSTKSRKPKTTPDSGKKRGGPVYFGISINADIVGAVDKQFGASPPEIWKKVKSGSGGSVQTEFHVTLAHASSNSTMFKELSSKFKQVLDSSEVGTTRIALLPEVDTVHLESLCYDEKIIAVKVSLGTNKVAGQAHITVGFLDGVRPKYSNDMLAKDHEEILWTVIPKTLEGQKLYAFV